MKKIHFFLSSVGVLAFTDVFLVHDAAWLVRHGTGLRFYVNWAVSTLFLAAALWLVRAGLARWKASEVMRRFKGQVCVCLWTVTAALVALPALAQLAHFKVYNDTIRPNGFDFAAKNAMETMTYFFDLISLPRMFLAVVGLAAGLILLARSVDSCAPRRPLLSRTGLAVCSLLVCGLLPAGAYNWYSVALYQNSVYAFYGTLLESFSIRFGAFAFQKPTVPPDARTARDLPNIIWVVGESAARSHMQIYGYRRPTTPKLQALLDDGTLVRFDDMLAVGNKTMLSLPYMLFGLEGPDPKGRIYSHPSIFNYAKARGMRTAFFSAQDIRWYNFDKLVVDNSLDVVRPGPEFSANVTVRTGADDHDVIRKGVLPFVTETSAPFFLVYQMNGSHYPYADHSPPWAKIFLPEGEPNSRNAYDNSVRYSDSALAELVENVRRQKPNTWIFFVSDHGQSIADGRESKAQFHAGYDADVIVVPSFVVPPVTLLPNELATLRENAKGPTSQSDIFATVLDIFDATPIRPIDGLSWRVPVPPDRVRICSEFMPTFSNNPNAAYVDENRRIFRLDFTKMQVFDDQNNLHSRISELDKSILKVLERRL
ncbi:MAG: sulfatase-like hydrolase/transferase [Silvanigrellales bacterium]|nr:sulfatase-like hydrolase/transferase [Silvanigrellales bacterium]